MSLPFDKKFGIILSIVVKNGQRLSIIWKKSIMSEARHKFLFAVLKPIVRVYSRLKFGFTYQKLKKKDLPEKYLILSNHTTDFDPLFLGIATPGHSYFVASEHITRFKVYNLIKWVFNPIIRYKGTVASSTVLDVLRRVRKGNNVALMAEGVRTFDGVTCPILPSTAKLVKAAKCGLITYKLTGGYFASPLWSSSGNTRKGKVYGAPVNVYTKEQIAQMSETELHLAITQDLYEDAYERQLKAPIRYKGKNLSDGLETLLFVCPTCNSRAKFESQGERIVCKECGLEIRYDEYGTLHGAPYSSVRDFSRWQDEVIDQDVENAVPYEAECAELYEIQSNHEGALKSKGKLVMTAEKLTCGDTDLLLESIYDMSTCGRYKLMFSSGKVNYELVLAPKGNVVRFCKYFRACKNKSEANAINAINA